MNRQGGTPLFSSTNQVGSTSTSRNAYSRIDDEDGRSCSSEATISSQEEMIANGDSSAARVYYEERFSSPRRETQADSRFEHIPKTNTNETSVKVPLTNSSFPGHRTSSNTAPSTMGLSDQSQRQTLSTRERSTHAGFPIQRTTNYQQRSNILEGQHSLKRQGASVNRNSSAERCCLPASTSTVSSGGRRDLPKISRNTAHISERASRMINLERPPAPPPRQQSLRSGPSAAEEQNSGFRFNFNGHKLRNTTPAGRISREGGNQVLVPLSCVFSGNEEKTTSGWKWNVFKKNSKSKISAPYDTRHMQHGRNDSSGRLEVVEESFLNTFDAMQIGNGSSKSTLKDARDVGAHLKVLQAQFKGLLREKRWTDAARCSDNFSQVVESQYSADECLAETKASGRSKNLFRALLYSNAAANLHRRSADSLSAMKGIEESVLEMKQLATEMMHGQDSDTAKLVIRHHLISVMTYKRHDIRTIIGVPETLQCLSEVWALHCIEFCQSLIGDLDGEKETLDIALSNLRATLGDSVSKYHVYGLCLHNLGIVYHNQSNFNDSAVALESALTAKAIANDYETDDAKASEIAATRDALHNVENALWSIRSGTGNVPVLV